MAGKTQIEGITIAGGWSPSACLAGALSLLPLIPVAMPVCLAAELNLGSSETHYTVDQSHQGTVNLTVNGDQKQVGAGASLTAAEYAAFVNAIHGHEQTLNIGAGGVAVGGTLNLTPQLAANITGLVVPTNVAVVHDFGLNSSLNLTGNLVNSGSFYAISTNSAVTNAVLSASNLTNNQGALLTSVLPTAGLAGITGAISNLSLTLNIVNTLTNMGTISSAGNLNINAGAIYNQLPSSGISPIMQAVNNLNLNATLGNITNQGILAATTGNVNLTSVNNLVVNNVNGSIQALVGNINIHHTANILQTLNINVTGGDWLSRQLNIDAGYGVVEANLNDITGQVNVNASAASLGAATPNLNLGNINITGDPTWFNTAGNVLLSGPIVATGASPNIAILANGHIISVTGATIIDSSSAQTGGNGGTLTLVAGANFTSGSGSGTNDTGTMLIISSPSGAAPGGGIYLDGTAPTGFVGTPAAITGMTSAGTSGNNSGGDIALVAYAGTAAGSGVVRLPSAVTVTSGGSGTGTNGNITILAGATSGTSISTGGLQTSGSTSTAGSITVAAATPTINGSGSVTILGGAIQGGSGNFVAGVLQTGAISVGNLLAAGAGSAGNLVGPIGPGGKGGDITVTGSSAVATGSLRAYGGGGGGGVSAGIAPGAGGAGGSILVSTIGNVTIDGDVNASGGGGGGGALGSFGAGGNAGSVNITATGLLNISGPVLAAGGGAGGTSPNASGAGGGGGSFGGGGGASYASSSNSGGGGGGGFYAGGGGGAGVGNGGGGGGGGFSGGGGGGGGGTSISPTEFGGGGGGGGGLGTGGGGGGLSGFLSNTGGAGGGGGTGGSPGTTSGGMTGSGGSGFGGGGAGSSSSGPGNGSGGAGGNGGAAGSGTGAGGTPSAGTGGNGGIFGSGGGTGQNVATTGGAIGTSGAGGTIVLSGQKVSLTGTVGSASANWPGFGTSVYAGDSVNALGTGGSITITSRGGAISPVYSTDGNYAAGAVTAPVTITAANSLTSAGGMQAPSITFSSVVQASPVAAGSFAGLAEISLLEGSNVINVVSGNSVTPAELVALIQGSTTGTQTLVLSQPVSTVLPGTGFASGGSFIIAPANLPGSFTSLNLPASVTATVTAPSIAYSGTALINGTLNFATGGTLTVNGSVTGAGSAGASTGTFSLVSQTGNIGAVGTPFNISVGAGTNISLTANSGSITVGNLLTAGAGGNAGSVSPQTVGQNGGDGGSVIVQSSGTIATGFIRTFGGGGGGGGLSRAGGTGGKGGAINLSSSSAITVTGDINSSGGGGGGSGLFGGTTAGGDAGNITLAATSALTVSGPVLAAGGGRAGGIDGGGGGSFGGGGGASYSDSIGPGGGGGFYGGGGAGGNGNNRGGAGGGGGFASGGGGGGGSYGPSGPGGGGGGGGGGLGQGGGSGFNGAAGGGAGGGDSTTNGLPGAAPGTTGGQGGAGGSSAGGGGSGSVGSSTGGLLPSGGAGGTGSPTGGGSGVGLSNGGAFGVGGKGAVNGKDVGDGGAGGVISITAASISLTGTIGAASANWPGFASSVYAGDTINTLGTGGTISITTTASDFVSGNVAGNIRAGSNVHLQASNIGSSLLPAGAVSVISPNVSAVATGFANITNSFSLSGAGTGTVAIVGDPVTGNSSAGTSFILTVPNALMLTSSAPLTAQNVTLTTGQATASIIAGSNITATMNVTLNSPTVGTNLGAAINGASVIFANTHNSDLTISNAGSITATTGSITASSPAGMNLNVTGGGTMNALVGGTTLTATTSGATANNVNFTGSQTFNGPTTLNASGVNQAVVVNNNTVVTGNNLLLLNTLKLDKIGNGVITGNPLVLFAPAGKAGTIANSAGNIDLATLGNLTFVGQSLAMLASGSIVNTGGARTINLSTSNNATAGSLTLIAGFNFTPATAGVVGPNAIPYTLSTSATGSINLSNVAVNTSSTQGSGGSVLAVANGAVTLGAINTSAPLGLAGNVTVIGTGITTGAITATGGAFGAVSLTSSTPQMVTPVTVTQGVITAGSFAAGALAGNVTYGSISAGSGGITLATGGAGFLFQQGMLSTTGLLSVTTGTNNINLFAFTAGSLQFNTAASVFATAVQSTALNLAATNVTNTLSLISGAPITVTGAVTAGNVSITTFGLNTPITVNQPITATVSGLNPMAAVNLTATGAITIAGALTANRVNVTSGFNTNINVNANIAGSGTNPVITLSAFGTGNITQGGGTIGNGLAGTSLVLQSSTGSFGTAANRLLTNVDTLSFSSFVGSNAFITETNGLTLGAANFIGTDLDLRTNGNTVFNGVFAGRHISIDVQTGGTLTQNMGMVLQSTGGGIALTTANNVANTIVLNGAILTGGNNASSAININGGGNITLGFMNSFGPTQGNITVTSQQGSIDIAPNQSVLASIGDITLTSGTVQNLNGFIRTLQSGSITLISRGAVTTRGLSTGSLGSLRNDISVLGSAAGTNVTFTLQPGALLSTGNNGDITVRPTSGAGGNGNVDLTGGFIIQNGVGNLLIETVDGSGTSIKLGQLTQVAEGNITVRTTAGASSSLTLPQNGLVVTNATQSGRGNITLTGTNGGSNVVLNGSVRTNLRGNITVGPSAAGNSTVFNLSTGSLGAAGDNDILVTVGGTGSITVLPNAVISTGNNGNISISTASGLDGNILIDGSLSTFGSSNSNININARRDLTINRPINSANGTVTLHANNGSVTTGATAQITAGGAVSITSKISFASQTVANITLNAGVQKVANAGAITIQSFQQLSVGSVSNNNGNISLRADSGNLSVRNSSVLQTLTGDINIQQRGLLAGDLITFGSGVSVIALAPANPLGNINVFVDPGAGPPVQQAGTAPPNVQQLTSSGGQIFFGANFNPGISATGPINTLFAKGANITFFTAAGSAAGSNAITLGGSNFFFADPPASGSPSVVPIVPAHTSGAGVLVTPLSQVAPGRSFAGTTFGVANFQSTVPSDSVSAFRSFSAGAKLATGSAEILSAPLSSHRANQVGARVEASLHPGTDCTIDLSQRPGAARLTGFVAKKAGVFGVPTTQVRAHRGSFTQPDERTIYLSEGEILVSAGRRSVVNAGAFIVDIGPGAIAHIVREERILKVRNLCDSSGKSVSVRIGQRTLTVGVGEELLVGADSAAVDRVLKQDKLGRRELKKHGLDDGNYLAMSEFSIVGLIQRSELLYSMYAKGAPGDRAIIERVMKMAAAVFQVTGKRGAYSAYQSGGAAVAEQRQDGMKLAQSN